MKLKKHYRGPGYVVSAAGLVLTGIGLLMFRNFFVSADSMSAGVSLEYAMWAFFAGIVVIVASIILMMIAFFGASSK